MQQAMVLKGVHTFRGDMYIVNWPTHNGLFKLSVFPLPPLHPPPPSASAPFIEKRGFLYKEGGQRKTWKLRYFVLQPGMFTYYKTNSVSSASALCGVWEGSAYGDV